MDRILVSKTSDMGSSPTKVREAADPNGVADDQTNDKIQKQNISLASDFWIGGIFASME